MGKRPALGAKKPTLISIEQSSMIGFMAHTLEMNAAYLHNWLRVLRSDKGAIFRHAADAQRACLGYVLFVPYQSDVVPQKDPTSAELLELSLNQAVSLKLETLPTAISDTVTLNDVVFLPRMRIMEYVYVTATRDVVSLQTFVEGRGECLCREIRAMFGEKITLRNSFETVDGDVLRRMYLLEEDCQRFL